MTSIRAIACGFVGGWLAVAAWLVLGFSSLLPGPGLVQTVQTVDSGFERRVRGVLLSNPQLLDETRQRQETRRRQALDAKAAEVIAVRAKEIFGDASDPDGGNPNGDVSLVEFFDYNCPYCRKVAPTLI